MVKGRGVLDGFFVSVIVTKVRHYPPKIIELSPQFNTSLDQWETFGAFTKEEGLMLIEM